MGTWLGIIATTTHPADFWTAVHAHGVQRTPASLAAPPAGHALIDGDWGWDMSAPTGLARSLSRDLKIDTLAFMAQTSAGVFEVTSYRLGERIGELAYSRDGGGWLEVVGDPQPWEAACFFDTSLTDEWPSILDDDISDEDAARYARALAASDPRAVLDLLHPDSMYPLVRLCRFFGLDPERLDGKWRKPSLWRRLFARA